MSTRGDRDTTRDRRPVTADAILLAGGASTRFGADKLAASLDGRPVLAHAVDAARALGGRIVVVVAPDDPGPSIDGIEVVRDAVAHRGPLAGLVTGLSSLAGGRPAVVLAGDMPAVRPAVLALLLEALEADASASAAHLEAEPLHPLPLAIRPGPALEAARRLLAADRRSLRALVTALPSIAVPAARWRALDPGGETLRDVDTPADLVRQPTSRAVDRRL